MFTVDASVWVNAESPAEIGYSDSRALLDTLAATQTLIIAPTLLPIELAGVISRTRGNSQLAEQMADALCALPHIQWISLDEILSQSAGVFAARNRLRGADAVYAAVAAAHNCVLVTLDHEQLTRLPPLLPTMIPAGALQRLSAPPP